jgi:ribose 5-phosphate isomerase A
VTRDDAMSGGVDDPGIQAVAASALERVYDGARVGLGSGRATTAFIRQLGARLHAGLRVVGVPTSNAAAAEAKSAGIPLIELGEGVSLDVTIDGADEVAPNLDLVKGWGGALVRERIVAAASASQVILVGADKLVRALGERRRVPVEVVPFARWTAIREFTMLGLIATLWMDSGGQQPFVTDNGNLLIDCVPPQPLTGDGARELERALRAVAGVVDTGFFLGTASRVLVGHPDGHVETMERTPR